MSLCMAMRLRSRQTICITGSRPVCTSSAETATLDMRTTAVWLSVTFTASTAPRSNSAFFRTTSRSVPAGGPSSAVTAK